MRFAAAGLIVLAAGTARAGGMFLPMRGVHSLEQAGALVAGAADPDALWLDPAGLALLAGDGKTALMFDVGYVYQPVDYTRIDSGGHTDPTVANQQPGAVAPTIAGSLGIGDKLVIAGGISAPYGGFGRYDATGPQRYTSYGLDGTTFVAVTVGAGYAISPQLRIGATVQDVVSHVDLRVALWACPATCAGEDTGYDMAARVQETDYIAPSGSLGVQYDAAAAVTLGATLQAPTRVSASGAFTSTLPTSSQFEGATLAGNQASVAFTLPPSVRAGVQWRPSAAVRLEAALDVELWSFQDHIDISPDNLALVTPAGTKFPLAATTIARNYRTSFAPAVGGEYQLGDVTLGAGVSYETAAAPAADVSTLTVDSAKLIVGAGGGYAAEGWQIGGAIGYAHLANVDVPLASAAVTQLQPLRTPQSVAVNAGSYRSYDVVAGIRASRRF